MSLTPVKVTFESEGRVINKLVEMDLNSFEDIFRVIEEAFPGTFRLAWKDKEGDLVELETSKDLGLYISTKPVTYRLYAFPSALPRELSPSSREASPGRTKVSTLPKLTKPPAFEFVPRPIPHASGKRAVALPKLNARFVKHVSADEDSEYAPGTKFFKTWRFRNDGTLKWPTRLNLVYVSKLTGDQLGGPDQLTIPFTSQTEIGKEVDIEVPLIAPNAPGEYCGYWKLSDETGKKFGQRVRVKITVVPLEDKPLKSDQLAVLESLKDMGYHQAFETSKHYLVSREVTNLMDMVRKLDNLGIRMSLN